MMSLNSLSALTLSTPWKNRIFCKMVTTDQGPHIVYIYHLKDTICGKQYSHKRKKKKSKKDLTP